ncbi:pathogenesis-related protein 1-like [Prosopis cineraria]|uniref:pathogenesis-related protein 1-like n=1 Tax=Prosopis cineraria TaxID=364024 RepID=UPI00240EC4C6|nr:pathogenesis-related protein 1-like [Prosopis cineraria]
MNAYAQDSPQDYVNAHNKARSEVGVPDIVWNDAMADMAQNYADQRRGDCELVHSLGAPSMYGENLAWSSGDQMIGTDAVKLWVDEKANYDYDSNSCVNGTVCRHYTQVVWKSTVYVGCAKVRCYNESGIFIGCIYDPPGNRVGQRPFNRIEENAFCLFPSSEGKVIIR